MVRTRVPSRVSPPFPSHLFVVAGARALMHAEGSWNLSELGFRNWDVCIKYITFGNTRACILLSVLSDASHRLCSL